MKIKNQCKEIITVSTNKKQYTNETIRNVVEIADYLFKNIKNSKSIDIKSAGHFSNMKRPERFNEIILDFLKDK